MAYKKKTKKTKRHIDTAVVHVRSTFNNTIVSITTVGGDVLFSGSSGRQFKGSRKSTPYAATIVVTELAKQMHDAGIRSVEVNLQGPGSGRDSAVRALQASGVKITVLRDKTPLPHNGTRPPKKRRV